MTAHYKKHLLLASLLFCTQIKAPPAMEFGVTTETLKTLDHLPAATGAALKEAFKEIPTTMTVTVAFKLPTISKQNLYTFLGFVGAISGIRLIHTGVNLLTEPLKAPVCAKQRTAADQTPATGERLAAPSLADLQAIQANSRKWGFARCSAGLAILTCSALTIYKFGH